LRFVAEFEKGSDVVGTLTIGQTASRIEVESAYLDSWLAALLECLVAVSEGVMHYEVEVIEESALLIADTAGGEVLLRFGEQMIRLGSVALAIATITSDVRELLHRHRLGNDTLVREIKTKLAALTTPMSLDRKL